MHIPAEVRARMKKAAENRDAQAEEGVAIAAEALRAFKDQVQGAYIMPPFGRVEMALELLQRI